MLSSHEARYVLDCLLEGGMGDAERQRLRLELSDFIDHAGSEIQTLTAAHQHEASESARHFTDASQKDGELRTLRGALGQCRGELAGLTEAAVRACDLLESRPMTSDVADAIQAVRVAMKGKQAKHYASVLSESVRKFDALAIVRRMLRKLCVSEDVYRAADEWAKKQFQV